MTVTPRVIWPLKHLRRLRTVPRVTSGPPSLFLNVSYRYYAVRASHVIDREPHSPVNGAGGPQSQPQSHSKSKSNYITLTIDARSHNFSPHFLRDACPCPQCIDPSTSQKLFKTSSLPPDLHASSITHSPTTSSSSPTSTTITWQNDPDPDHRSSTYPTTLLRSFTRLPSPPAKLPLFASLAPIPLPPTQLHPPLTPSTFPHTSYTTDPQTLQSALSALLTRGIFHLHSVPSTPLSLQTISSRLGPLRNTFYGLTWDVRATTSPKNIANTPLPLALHQDLLYYHHPPTYQILHCLTNTARGGATLFSDGILAATKLRNTHPDLFDILAEVPVPYQYKNGGVWYRWEHPVVELDTSVAEIELDQRDVSEMRRAGKVTDFDHRDGDGDGAHGREKNEKTDDKEPRIRAVNWSPPFQTSMAFNTSVGRGAEVWERWLQGIRMFAGFLEDGVWEKRLEEGEAVVWDNRRLVHGRRAFSHGGGSGGERWLRGGYVDKDAVESLWRSRGDWMGEVEREEG